MFLFIMEEFVQNKERKKESKNKILTHTHKFKKKLTVE